MSEAIASVAASAIAPDTCTNTAPEDNRSQVTFEQSQSWYGLSTESIDDLIKVLANENHTYDSIVHACAAVAVQAAHKMNKQPCGGITGFQGGAVMWEFIRSWMGIDSPMKLLNYENLLYPQYTDKFEKTISKDVALWLQDKATKLRLDTKSVPHPEVAEHWKRISEGHLPFGFVIKD